MINGIIFLVFLNIFIHLNSGIYFFQHKQIVGVSGNFNCKYKNSSFVTVTLSKHDYIIEKHPLAKIRVKVGTPFHLMAKSYSYRKFDVYIKIYHDCFRSTGTLHGLSIKKVPAKYIYKKSQLCDFYKLGTVRLDYLPTKFYHLSNKKNGP
uniref:Transthyretin-like family-containing protein n=1 Tax=Strongyloides stercoralis TaxID=6248 RepID=A0A0K0ENF8_STRER